MNNKQLIFRNIKSNIQNYFLYIFALIFTVALYFTFTTLQFDDAMDELTYLVEGEAAIQVGAIFLVIIVAIFLLYANNLFLKRRSKEIGLYQLVGMSKKQIIRIVSVESLLLYISSFFIGIFIGFSVSKLFVMILFKMIRIEAITSLHFSFDALIQTIVVFACIFLLLLLMNYVFVSRQSLLSLFQKTTTTEEMNGGISVYTAISGVIGIISILFSYYLSSKLFSGDFSGNTLFYVMFIIASMLSAGTYLFFKGSVGLILQLIRKKQNGHVTVSSVLSLSTIMFRMKSNALLLTIITLLSTVAITLSSIAYIAYHSAEQTVKEMIPYDFSIFDEEEAVVFTDRLAKQNISYTVHHIPILHVFVDIRDALIPESYDNLDINEKPKMLLSVITDSTLNLAVDEVVLSKPDDLVGNMLAFKETGEVTFLGKENEISLKFIGLKEESVLPSRLTNGFPVVIVHEDMYERLKTDGDTSLSLRNEYPLYIGIELEDKGQVREANDIFQSLRLNKWTGAWSGFESQLDIRTSHVQGMGLIIFITGFLGLTFLITSGCILYFRQMDESETETDSFTVLRKLGFTKEDLLRGIRFKQLLNFGIPLVIGLTNSYFVVKSGWFIFGKEMLTPMLIVIGIYTGLYSVFAILSVQYYKKVIRDSL